MSSGSGQAAGLTGLGGHGLTSPGGPVSHTISGVSLTRLQSFSGQGSGKW